MPVNPTYPGVYIQEIPSGVRTITGVSTAVTAFAGLAPSGPVNFAKHILSLRDYERTFGGLDAGSEMSYAVSQFFLNGGNEAWVVRLAKNPAQASLDLKDSDGNGALKVTAIYEGLDGNNIQALVDDSSTVPSLGANRFNLTFIYAPVSNPANGIIETFQNLSMNPNDPSGRFVKDMINDISQLVTVSVDKPTAPATTTKPPAVLKPVRGTLTSNLPQDTDPKTIVLDDNHNSFNIGFDGNPASLVKIDTRNPALPPANSDLATVLKDVAGRIQAAVRATKPGLESWRAFTCTVKDNKQLVLTSGTVSANSAVDVQAATSKDIAQELHLIGDGVTKSPSVGMNLKDGSGDSFDLNTGFSEFFPDTSDPQKAHDGIHALDTVDLFNLLCLPGVTDPGILSEAIAYCQSRRAFLIIDPPVHPGSGGNPPTGFTPDDMVKYITGPNLTKGAFGEYAAIYYPNIKIPDPLKNGKLRLLGPGGTIAGLYARTDNTRGVWKAPAGTEAVLVGVLGLDTVLTDDENGILNPHAVNCLRVFPVYGIVSWGSRTVSGDDQIASEYKYVPVRRLANYIEESLFRGTKWVVFEPNDEPLWAQIRLNIGAFMHDLFRKGAFQGKTPREAYFVKCDADTTTQNDIDHGIVNIIVGFAPLKPAEFVIISIQQIAGQLQV